LVFFSGIATPVSAFEAEDEADIEFVRSLVERQFYLDDVDLRSADSVEGLIHELGNLRHDSWAEVVESEIPKQLTIRRNGYGLRVLRFNEDRFYLLPELGSPNKLVEFHVYPVRKPPVNGDWGTALENGELILEDTSVEFRSEDYLARAAEVSGEIVRIDDFVNPSLDSYLSKASDEVSGASVIDLRFNSGGRVDFAIKFLQVLTGVDLPLGYIERRGELTSLGKPADDKSIALARERLGSVTVLVSRFTASTAEWLARNLQLYGATLIGERSTGKCLIHKNFAIGAGRTLKLAVGKLQVHRSLSVEKKSIYSYCDFGLIPDYSIDGRLLVSRPASWLVELISR